jgi:xanthosine utilization system XapX-like protein
MSRDILAVVGILGVTIAIGVAIYWWERRMSRLIPFLYSTVLSFVWFGETAESFADLVMHALVVNSANVFMLFFAWLQIREPHPPVR